MMSEKRKSGAGSAVQLGLLAHEGGLGASPITLLKTDVQGEKSGFNRIFLKRFWHLSAIGFRSPCSGMSIAFIALIVLNVASAFGLTIIGTMTGPLLFALISKDMPTTLLILFKVLMLGLVLGFITVTTAYIAERVRLDWRGEIVKKMQAQLFRKNLLFLLNNLDKNLDNTDQRITQDVENFTISAAQVLLGSYTKTINIWYLLAGVTGSSILVAKTLDATPILLCAGYCLVAMVVTSLVIMPVVSATYRVNQSRGFFRFAHARVKEYSEAIVFLNGQSRESFSMAEQFETLYWRFRALFKRQFFVDLWSTFQLGYSAPFAIFTISLAVRPNLVLDGHVVSVAVIGSLVSQLTQFIASLAAIPALYTAVGQLAGYTHRLGQMFEGMDQLEEAADLIEAKGISVRPGPVVRMQNVTCLTPDGETLFRDFQLSIAAGENTLIMGPSGAGKSSLLRVLGGLWPHDHGAITVPNKVGEGGVLFVPQRPYITNGTLRQQVVYPKDEKDCMRDDIRIKALLDDLLLSFLYQDSEDGLDRMAVWQDMLSGGEQQRLGFARLFYHSPTFAFMDEATSALDVPLERRVMNKCRELGITCVSVGHRHTLLDYHEQVMELDGLGGFHMREAVSEHDQRLEDLAAGVREEDDALLEANKKPRARASTVDRKPMFNLPEITAEEDVQFDSEFFRRLWRLFRSGFPVVFCKPTFVLTCAISLGIVGQIINLEIVFLAPKLIQSLLNKEWEVFGNLLLLAIAVVGGTAIVNAGTNWMQNVLSLYWYRAIVEDAHSMYFHNRTAYAINQLAPAIDNVDQRVCADAYQMCTTFGIILFGGAGTSIFSQFLGIALSIYAAARFGWLPIVCAILYAVITLSVTTCLMKPIVPWTYAKNHKEGDFRQVHTRIREFSESITFYRGQSKEMATSDRTWQELYTTYRTLIWKQFPVNAWNKAVIILGQFVGFGLYLLQIAIYGWPKVLDVALLETEIGLLAKLIASVCSLPAVLTQLATVAGLAHRVGQMLDTMDVIDKTYQQFDRERRIVKAGTVSVRNLTCRTPDGQPLFRNMTFEVPRNQHLLIMGPSGAGKSSLLRVIGGLWPFEQGVLHKPSKVGHAGIFFVPQRPYLIQGSTLREQLIYPHATSAQRISDDALIDLMRQVDLDFLLGRMNGGLSSTAHWADMLSGGEQQRVGIVRLLYHKPLYAIMDESTSALDVELEGRCMELCKEAGITCISVGHRLTLIPHHSSIMRLDGRGGFTKEAINL